MLKPAWLWTSLSCLLLAACGGGTVNSTSTPTPSPTPTPTPVSNAIANLIGQQSFPKAAAKSEMNITVPSGIVQSGSESRPTIMVRYDAASQSYTVTETDRSRTFTQTDMRPERFSGETSYGRSTENTSSYLTLANAPYHGRLSANRYVGLGYWQENVRVGDTQQTRFTSFTYGSVTATSSIPRTGTAHWLTDIFGILMMNGQELRTIQADGDFDIDFSIGAFVATANIDESDIVSGGGAGGSLRFEAGGTLGSGSDFTGAFGYGSSGMGLLTGTLSGSFYGPGAAEIGGIFNASNGTSSLSGAFTGQQSSLANTSDGIGPVSLTGLLRDYRFRSYQAFINHEDREGEPGLFYNLTAASGNQVFTVGPNGPTEMGVRSLGYRPAAADRVAGPANFDSYRTTLSGNIPIEVSIYKLGSANAELALNYVNLARWSMVETHSLPNGRKGFFASDHYVVYGVETMPALLVGRNGTASYAGVVYGKGAQPNGLLFDVGGTSRFTVDFSASRYSASLSLTRSDAGAAPSPLGTFDFGAAITNGTMLQASFIHPSHSSANNQLQPYFYGTSAQEIGATFQLRTGDGLDPASMFIAGATVARQQ